MKGPLRCREHLLAFTLSLLATSPPVSAEEVSIAGNITSAGSSPRVEEPCNEEGCPPCGLLFTKVVEANDSNSLGSGDGLRVQMIDVMERGEPKSGTGFMFEWAAGSLVHACDYLKAMFGESSCTVEWQIKDDPIGDLVDVEMTFEPHPGGGEGVEGHCSCENVDRVHIHLCRNNKHALPMPHGCRLSHPPRIPPEGQVACVFEDGTAPRNFMELWHCMEKAVCEPNDDRRQMAIFRDPRPTVVSTYFFLQRYDMLGNTETVDEYVVRMLPTICQWMAVRFIIFEGIMAHQSDIFWYEDATADPLQWHYDWYASVGLQLPSEVVEAAMSAALQHEYLFPTKGFDIHPGGSAVAPGRSYKDEISAETLEGLDAVLRTWLPPVMLVRFGVSQV